MTPLVPNPRISIITALRLKNANGWLLESIGGSPDGRYQHLLLKEIGSQRMAITSDLRQVVCNAHADAKNKLRALAGTSLDPFSLGSTDDPARGYPEELDLQTLQGYFGEIFAGIAAETYKPFGRNWEVPALPFRFHNVAFDQLERFRQTGKKPGRIPGRTGDDMVAFELDINGEIIGTLFCEAKCTFTHDASLVGDAHAKISEDTLKPVELLRLISILEDYDDASSRKWISALRHLNLRKIGTFRYERFDLVSYVCGKAPARKKQPSWISIAKPHVKYTGRRRLQVIEAQLDGNVKALIEEIYGKR